MSARRLPVPHRPAGTLWGCLILLAIRPVPVVGAVGPAEIEERMTGLASEVQRLAGSEDWDGATAAIRQMAALDPEHPKVYIEAVQLHMRTQRLTEAEAFIGELGSDGGPGRAFATGMILTYQQQLPDAASRFGKALESYRGASHLAGQAASLNALGITALQLGNLDEAVERYESALALLDRIPDPQGAVGVRSNLADTESRLGRPERALEWQRSLLTIREEMQDTPGQALTWNNIGRSLSRLGKRTEAAQAHERALALHAEMNDLPGRVSTLELLMHMHAGFDDWARVSSRFQDALALAAQAPDRTLEAEVRRTLGEVHLAHGRNREAKEPLAAASAIYGELGRPREEAQVDVLLATALIELGEYRKARSLLSPVAEAARKSADRSLEADALVNLSNANLALGATTQALTQQERALALHRETGNRIAERRSLNNVGVSYFYLGRYDRAAEYVELAVPLAERLDDSAAVALAHNNLGAILAEQGQLEPALDRIGLAIEMRERLSDTRGAALGRANLAEILLRSGRTNEAFEEIDRALAVFDASGDLPGMARASNLRGEALTARHDPDVAVQAHRRALAIADDVGLVEEQWRAHAGLAAALAAGGQRAAAIDEMLRAVDGVERARAGIETDELRMRFLARKIDVYEQALAVMMPTHGTAPDGRVVDRGFELSERARARSLLDLLAESRSRMGSRLDGELQRREEVALDRANAAAVRLSVVESPSARDAARLELIEAETELERLEIEIRRGEPRYAEIVYPVPVTASELRSDVLREGEVLLEYFVGERRAWLWVADRAGVKVHALVSPAEIHERVAAFLAEARGADADLAGRRPDIAAAERLAAAVLPPRPLPRGSRLLVAPDGPLHHVPFGALRGGGRFLIEDHEITVVPSATALRLMRHLPAARAAGGFLGVGDPIAREKDPEFPSLPYSGMEIERIGRLFPEAERRTLTGAAATQDKLGALDLGRFRYVHFATHGRLESHNARLSGLALTAVPGDPTGHVLTSADILGLRLDSDLVVLSACRSGLGELLRGEGLVSLTRAFLYAGSRSVVVSLWDVGDRSTADFMGSFYEGLLRGEPAASALRGAKLSFLESESPSRREIFRWAPFVLVGDPGESRNALNPAPPAPTKRVQE